MLSWLIAKSDEMCISLIKFFRVGSFFVEASLYHKQKPGRKMKECYLEIWEVYSS